AVVVVFRARSLAVEFHRVRRCRRTVGHRAAIQAEHDPSASARDRSLRVHYVFWPPRSGRRVLQCAVFGTAMTAMLMPWIVRNYQYTGALLPTSTHGGIQLWYGTLQTGKYIESRAHNPRYIFASAAF